MVNEVGRQSYNRTILALDSVYNNFHWYHVTRWTFLYNYTTQVLIIMF